MAKESAIGDRLYVAGYDLSGDVGVVGNLATMRALLDVRGIRQTAMERIAGVADGMISFNAYYNPSVGQEHAVLSGVPATDTEVVYFHGQALGNAAAGLTARQMMYDPTLGEDGSLMLAVECPAGNGAPLEWGVQLTSGHRTDSSATTPSTGVDTTTTSTQFGASLYVQIFGFAGTNVRFRLRDSANGTTWGNVTGAYSDPVTAIGAFRLATDTTRTIRRYLQVQTTGTFSNCEFAAMVVRFATAQS